MKGNRRAYKPVSEEREINEVKDVFRQDPTAVEEDNPLMMTSIRLRAKTRTAAKLYAVEHGMKLQDVIDAALRQYLGMK
ncbi:macrolide ABC transporter ATP-binding protein [Bifidobacterium miconisargentati]|uniref:macrolide ABC transporter ATP-binding protein n=1 Tax=Bifidobacterium miconisargentati TaxID=2834437 RepID=UPI001BDD0FE8|nr:macrolide ABC transporter ATP-binding protein [Bifidobacterium miconisargentati]MBW3090011.1 macrolide ABC transporter ATP-binding protein [Bifidobacterium miconisargentati]